jgi:hypothetical protein
MASTIARASPRAAAAQRTCSPLCPQGRLKNRKQTFMHPSAWKAAIGYTGYDLGSSHPPPGAEGLVVITGLLPPAGHSRWARARPL